ncbi:MAG: hypothetical protein ACLTW9_13745 [Enterocloster sp.]
MENKKIDMKWCSGYCRQYWPEECAHILRIADDAVAQRFLFDLPWDMEQTVKAVTFEGKNRLAAYARRRPGIHIPV